MAIGTLTDFKIYDPQFQAGVWERVNQVIDLWNQATGNTLVLTSESKPGQYEKMAFFQRVGGLISRRDPTSTSNVDAVKPTQGELVHVKLNRRIGPVDYTLDSLRKIAQDQEEMSFILGQMVGEAKAQEMINTGILAVTAALKGQAALQYDNTPNTVKTLNAQAVNRGIALFGDQGQRIRTLISHSKPYYDLVEGQIGDKITNIADRVIDGGRPATLNRPMALSDIPALHDDNGSLTDTYNVLGLTTAALEVTETEQAPMVTEIITGKDNLIFRMQSEYAMNIGIKGMKWNVAGGGANPDNTALGTSSNWVKEMTDNKDLPGVLIICQ